MTNIRAEDLSAPAVVPRIRRPSWRDPRLLWGIFLILGSVAAVIALVASQTRTTAVFAADEHLSAGDLLRAEDLREVPVRIEDSGERYLVAADALPEDLHLVRAVGEGELVPRSALAREDPQGRQPVAVEIEHELVRAVEKGRMVDVWAASAVTTAAETSEVDRLVTAAEVTDIRESSSAFGAHQAVTVELLVAPEELSGLLAAAGSGSGLSVLPANTAAGEEDSA